MLTLRTSLDANFLTHSESKSQREAPLEFVRALKVPTRYLARSCLQYQTCLALPWPPKHSCEQTPNMAQEEMKVDEGYSGGSEETRSLSDSDSTMHIDPVDGHVSKSSTPTLESMLSGVLSLPPAQRSAFITSLLQLIPESERYGICITRSYPRSIHLMSSRNRLYSSTLASHFIHRIHSRTPQPPPSSRPSSLPTARNYFSNLPPPLTLRSPPMLDRFPTLARTCLGQHSVEILLRP